MLKRRFAFLAVVVATLIGGPLATGRASAGWTADLTAMTNADRAAARLPALSTAADLQALAQRRAEEMARAGRIAHTSNLGSRISGWRRVGENVGRGPALRDIQTAFMNSPSHRDNILDRGFTQLGVGVVYDGKAYLYVAVIFREPSGSSTTAAPPPSTTPTTRKASAPKPKPTTTTQKPTTTTQAPTTTTTEAPPPPPPPPPVEELARGDVPMPTVPIETTTSTTRPIFADKDFLAANFDDPIVPAAAMAPLAAPRAGRSLLPIVLATVAAAGVGLLVGRTWALTTARVEAQRRDGRPGQPDPPGQLWR